MKEDILDTEIRVISSEGNKPEKRKVWLWLVVGAAVVVAFALTIYFILSDRNGNNDTGSVFEQEEQHSQPHPEILQDWLCSLDSIQTIATATKDTLVNDIQMRVYVPLNSVPRLEIGYNVIDDSIKNILAFQAADVRADNLKIVGAFVLRGKPLSWGLSKRGYCAILGDSVYVGVADNSPLFERATEQRGYFFRQYPLVDNGRLVENEIKTKALRRGLCQMGHYTFVVETQTLESLHDFSQALEDMGVENAIYLVGGESMGWIRDADGNGMERGEWSGRKYKNVSFIVWSK